MRKLSSLLLVLGILAIAGCGSSSSGSDAESPLDNALGYLPADSPFVVAIDTDTNGEQYRAATDLIERFAFGDAIKKAIREELDEDGDFEQVEEALGNEFVVGSTDAGAFVNVPSGQDRSFVGAIQASNEDAIDKLLKEEKAEEDGEASGAKLYKDEDGDSFAVEGDVLIVAGSKKELTRALELREGDDRMTEEDFDAGTEGLPQDAMLRVYLDIGGLLRASDEAKQALEVKWVRALRTGGIALAFEQDRVSIDFDVDTDPEGLTDADVPIATGAASPQVLDRDGEIGVALRDLSHILEFARATAKEVDPDGSGEFDNSIAQIERQIDVDLEEDLLSQLEEDVAVSVGLDGKFGARAELEDPAKVERTLEKVSTVLSRLAEGATDERVGFAKPKAGEDFYALATADGERFVFGVVDKFFVISNDPAVAGSLAADRTAAVPGAKGAVVLKANAEELGQQILKQVEGDLLDSTGFELGDRIRGAIATRPLDELTGSIESSTEGLSGSFELTVDPK
ncbi:MAG TPA: DUF3352 domain-containing protein [Thermoleophilaceae bacterium]|nr:DUF3352 domain-containing protein [Thermoleophilaceae bacterium]